MFKDGRSIPTNEARRRARDKLLVETKKQVMKESRMIERTRSALMRETRAGAKELRLLDEMKKMRQDKDRRIMEVLRQNFGATDDDLCDRCAAERTQEGRTKAKPRDRSVSPRLETKIKEGETKRRTYNNLMNVMEECTGKVDRLLKDSFSC